VNPTNDYPREFRRVRDTLGECFAGSRARNRDEIRAPLNRARARARARVIVSVNALRRSLSRELIFFRELFAKAPAVPQCLAYPGRGMLSDLFYCLKVMSLLKNAGAALRCITRPRLYAATPRARFLFGIAANC